MKTDYQRVEGMLYNHYRRKKRVSSLKSRLIRTQLRIDRLRNDIKEYNIELSDTLKAIDYSREYVYTGDTTSNIEKELERAVDNILGKIEKEIREKKKIISRIRNLEKAIDDVEVLLEELSEEELQIIELRYGENIRSYRRMESLIPMGKSTIERKHKEVMKYLIDRLDE
ncbi:MAG TPA: hypothetical protein VK982_07875 [Bacteroidales bacterium]|nr:hypothetical protein [Bacteroidales bacterium]